MTDASKERVELREALEVVLRKWKRLKESGIPTDRAIGYQDCIDDVRAALAAVEREGPGREAACEKTMHLHVWSREPFFFAVAQAENVKAARELLLEEIGSSGDGSCPEREAAAEWVRTMQPHIWHRGNAEFALTDSAELRENELLVERLQKRIAALERAAQSPVNGGNDERTKL